MGENIEECSSARERVILSLEKYTKGKVNAAIESLQGEGVSPQLVIVFGSAIRGKELTVFPRWDVDVLIVVEELPKKMAERGLIIDGEKYSPVAPVVDRRVNFLELQPAGAMGWKSPQRGLHIQLGDLSWLGERAMKENNADFVHQIFKEGVLLWERKLGLTEELCEQRGLPLPSPDTETRWSSLVVEKQGNRII